MNISGQLKQLFKPAERPHSPTAELSVRTGDGSAEKDFKWAAVNIPCQKACPAGTDIPAYLESVAEGRFADAYRINLRDNVFPAVLGRVCSRPCEAACRHGYEGLGDSVAICFSKRSAADLKTMEPVLLAPWFPPSGKKVAIIGSGVAGLSAARDLKLMGHAVTVYEKGPRPGGMLNQGIPAFRLPREIIDREVGQIIGLGVELICNTSIGPDFPLTHLIERYDAVVMAAGAQKPNLLNIPGHDLDGIRHGLDFLQEVNETGSSPLGQSVLVIGGGFTAMDCARTARRLGARTTEWDLKVFYRRDRKNMQVTPEELDELQQEAIPLQCRAVPQAFLGEGGRLCGMRFLNSEMNTHFDVPANTVLLATGQFPDFSWMGTTDDLKHPELSRKLFTAGDYARGSSSLIEAIAHALDIAREVDHMLMGTKRVQKHIEIENAASTGRDRAMDQIERQSMPVLPPSDRNLPDEVERGYDEEQAILEAQRCYRCNYKFEIDQDKCIKCDLCLKARARSDCIQMLKKAVYDDEGCMISHRPTDTVRDMKMIWINSDACIRCGACLQACPVDAINLQKVSLCTSATINQSEANPEEQP